MSSPMSTFLIKGRVEGFSKEMVEVSNTKALFLQDTKEMVAPL